MFQYEASAAMPHSKKRQQWIGKETAVDWITNATSRPAGQSRRILACRRPDSAFASAVPRAAHVPDDRIGLIRINGLIGRGENTYWGDGGEGV
jgi:hypothetical protein